MLEDPVALDPQDKEIIVATKATCPFLGSLVAQDVLAVRGAADNPLAGIEDVRLVGNTGGGDLGDLLVFFAQGNHALMRGAGGNALDTPVPAGLFSLELPGSQGSHPGHSGILQGDPATLGSGRLSGADFDRLAGRAAAGRVTRSAVAAFIAENLRRDPHAKVSGTAVAELLAHDLGAFVEAIGPALIARLLPSPAHAAAAHRVLEEKLTHLLGEDNLVGSSGEFGLLFAFLANSPETREIAGEPALSLAEMRGMFVQKELPAGWQNWPKSRADWVVNTTWLMLGADKEYRRLGGG